MGVKKYFGEKPQKEPKPFSAQFGVEDDYDFDLIEETRPIYYPSPEKLAEYEELQEGAADRIIALVEEEQKQRHDWDKAALKEHYRLIKQSQNIAFFIITLIITAIVILGIIGAIIPAATLSLSGLFLLLFHFKRNAPKEISVQNILNKKFKHNNSNHNNHNKRRRFKSKRRR